LTKPKRGRKVAIGPIDGFLLFLHWLRTAAPIDSIAGAFHFRRFTLYKTLKTIAMEIHGQLAERFIATPSRDRWTAGEKFSDYGLMLMPHFKSGEDQPANLRRQSCSSPGNITPTV
jgi:hypothetical protein